MRFKLSIIFVLLSISCLLSWGQLGVVTYKLENGLTVFINEDTTQSKLFGAVVINAGGKYDPKDATGMAHYLEHMLFKGTEEMGTQDFVTEKPILDSITAFYEELGKTKDERLRKEIQKKINAVSVRAAKLAIPNEFDRLIKLMGGEDLNAFTTEEMTVYHNSFPSHQLDRWLEIYAHRFEKPVFRLFQPELEIVYEEKNRASDNAFGMLFEEMYKNFFRKHPYGTQTVLGSTEHLKNPPLKRMYEYFNTYYVPNNIALILSGKITLDSLTKAKIQARFGRLKPKVVPDFTKFPEDTFKGREFVQVRMTPVKVGAVCFRTAPNGHPDKEALDVLNSLLTNSGQTGLLDTLSLKRHLLQAGTYPIDLNDHGGNVLFFIPKLLGQGLEESEPLMLKAIESIKKGDFTEVQLNSVKNNLQKGFEKQLEGMEERVYLLCDMFSRNESWENKMKYPQKIATITKEDVVRVANQYFGKNYLTMYSRMGFPSKDKLKKPGFEPVAAKDSVKSTFAKSFENIATDTISANFVVFNKDFSRLDLERGVRLFHTNNPINGIFNFEIKYGKGEFEMPVLALAADYLQSVGTQTRTVQEFKTAMYQLGCTYSFSTDNDYVRVSVSGMEANLDSALALLNELMQKPAKDPKVLEKVIDDIEAARKIEAEDPQQFGFLLNSYLLYANNGTGKSRIPLKEMKKISVDSILNAFSNAMLFSAEIHYSGKKKATEVANIANSAIQFPLVPKETNSPNNIPKMEYQNNTVLFLPRNDARQSQIYFYLAGKPVDMSDMPAIQAFNSYFGGDMSAIIFQEIREFRSLAYSATATYRKPKKFGWNGYLGGYIGTQADKTIDAIDVMLNLLKNMPLKPDRTESIKQGLLQSAYSSRPNFRDLPSTAADWLQHGYSLDPSAFHLTAYQYLTFKLITEFYDKNIKDKPIIIAILGNPNEFDTKKLEAFGRVIKLKKEDVANE